MASHTSGSRTVHQPTQPKRCKIGARQIFLTSGPRMFGSPDLNPLDCFVSAAAERETNRSAHNTKQSLINSIMEVFAKFSREAVVTACSRVRSRLEEVVAANGDFIR